MYFRDKLEKMDEIIYSQLFSGAKEAVEPKYEYVKDELLLSTHKKRKMCNINDNIEWNLKHVTHIRDHQGNIITKSGSKFESLAELLKIKS